MGIVQAVEKFVKERLEGAEPGHDWSHTDRVRKLAGSIRSEEGSGDPLVIELAALLHDISDAKFNDGDEELGGKIAYEFLTDQGLDDERASHVRSIVLHISFKGGVPQDQIDTPEFRIVQDADRLDAMGAVGIARAFSYGGFRNRPMYDPSVPLKEYRNISEYRSSRAPTLHHFYEKLLLLKERMNTETGRRLAGERHRFMEEFLEQFRRECGL